MGEGSKFMANFGQIIMIQVCMKFESLVDSDIFS